MAVVVQVVAVLAVMAGLAVVLPLGWALVAVGCLGLVCGVLWEAAQGRRPRPGGGA
jgi:hypothetical protein